MSIFNMQMIKEVRKLWNVDENDFYNSLKLFSKLIESCGKHINISVFFHHDL